MTSRVRVVAPAKINWSLEVLRVRPDGYHEVRTVLQTIDLHDTIVLSRGADLTLAISGDAGMLGDAPPESNLAFRAALALRERTGVSAGAHIALEKRVPVAAGLGGGSSDAAAVLRGLNVLWDAGQSDANLIEIAGEIGSDPPFFLAGGTALASGRGEMVEALADAVAPALLLCAPRQNERGEKTAAMFGALRPEHFSDGYVAIGVRDAVQAGRELDDAELSNVFERVTGRMQPETELALDALRAQGLSPHLAGAGPSFFLLLGPGMEAGALSGRVRGLGFDATVVRCLPRGDALRMDVS